MNKTILKVSFVALVSSALMLFLLPFISPDISWITLFSFVGYFILTTLFLKVYEQKLSARQVVAIFVGTILLLQSYTFYTWFIWDLYGLPTVITYFLAVLSAYFYFVQKHPLRFGFLAVSGCFVLLMFFQGWGFWLHRVNYGTFTGVVADYDLPTKFEGLDVQGKFVTDSDFKNKIIVMDFWHTRCGICFSKFPTLNEGFDRYKNDSSIAIFAVNRPLDDDKPNQAFEMIKAKNYSFPVLVTKDEQLADKWGITRFPTTLVLNGAGKIVYKGDIEGALKMVANLKSTS